MYFLLGTGLSYCFAQLLATVMPSAAHFQTTGGGYTFSIPSFGDAEKRSQANAQAWCNGNKTQLLEIRNNDVQFWTKLFIGSAIGQNQMTGNTVITNGKRSNSGFVWVNGISITGITVYGQDPGFSHSYAYMKVTQSGFQIFADTPIVKRGYICEGSSFCGNGFRASERCCRAYTDQSSWYDARNLCTEGGGDLASFDFIANDTGFNVLNGSGLNPSSTYWIGLKRQFWTWQGSKSDVRYSQWLDDHPYYPDKTQQNPNSPYKECLCLEPHDWKWAECECNQAYQFVCITGTGTALTSSAAPITSGSPVYVPSTTIAGDTRTAHSLNTPTSVSKYESIPTAALANSISPDNSLAIGLGVGIGGGVLLIAVILVIVFVMMKRKGCPRKLGLQKSPPDVTPESYYATVVKNTEYDETTQGSNQVPPSTEYADLNIVAVSLSSDDRHQRGRSLV